MIISLYRDVFRNLFLSTKIFNTISEIQRDRYSLKYNDIVDLGWMIRNGHVALAKEKLNGNRELYISPKDIFDVVADKYPEMFVVIFERFKYIALEYYQCNPLGIIEQQKNIDIVRYLYENGYGPVELHLEICEMDVGVVEWLVVNGWLKITPKLLAASTFCMKLDQENYRYEKEMNELIVKHIEKPISVDGAKCLILGLFRNPYSGLLSSVLPLFDPRVKDEVSTEGLSFGEIIKLILDSDRKEAERDAFDSVQHRQDIRFKDPTLEHLYHRWHAWVGQGDHAFYELWETYADRITVTPDRLLFFMTVQDVDCRTQDHLLPIGGYLQTLLCLTANIKLIEFLWSQGINFTVPAAHHEVFYQELVKKKDQEDRHLIFNFCGTAFGHVVSGKQLLHFCCVYGQVDNFHYYLPLLIDDLLEAEILEIMFTAKDRHQYSCFKVLSAYIFQTTRDTDECLNIFRSLSLVYLLDQCDKLFARVPLQKRNQLCSNLLVIAIDSEDYVGVKHIFTRYKAASFSTDVMGRLASCRNTTIIDYVYTNRNTIFLGVPPKNIELFFSKIFGMVVMTSLAGLNLMGVEYFFKNCISQSQVSPVQWSSLQPYFGQDDSHRVISRDIKNFHSLVYLLDHHNTYNSMDCFIDSLVNRTDANPLESFEDVDDLDFGQEVDSDDDDDEYYDQFNTESKQDDDFFKYEHSGCDTINLLFIEYLYVHQDRLFKVKPSFQIVFDRIVFEKKYLKKYKVVLAALINRYGCTLKDDHYHFLDRHLNGLTLFGRFPNSMFVQPNFKPPPLPLVLKDKRSFKKSKIDWEW
ncbi:hypothetical protein CYY_005404 [Polysphondylium violaceum]|uniref:Uncharacterized protein n=1 Tax=Polysphondylium violaceum TaxID=133409 RepID=A0A8J4UYP1_9MYCE|nr:hypothetical protein CYY_005404 [Polysphondylium violaceum]